MSRKQQIWWILGMVGCLIIFMLLTGAYVWGWGTAEVDQAFGSGLVARVKPLTHDIFAVVTILGNTYFVAVVTVLISFAFIIKKQWQQLVIFLLAILSGWQLNNFLKAMVSRPRPAYPEAVHHMTSFSFPSGHAMISVLLFGSLTYILLPYLKTKAARRALLVGAVLLTLLVGFSRLVLGVHFLTDIAAGFAFSGFLLLLILFADQREWFRKPPLNRLY